MPTPEELVAEFVQSDTYKRYLAERAEQKSRREKRSSRILRTEPVVVIGTKG